ncbi:MAG: aspartyl protease family protein [Myxococcota bacterium]
MGGLLYVEAVVDGMGTPVSLIVDSGASVGVLRRPIVEQLKLGLTTPQPVRGVASRTQLQAAMAPGLRIGGLQIGPGWVYVLEAGDEWQTCDGPRGFDGIIGADVLWQLVTDIDYEEQTLRFATARSREHTAATVIALRPNASRIVQATMRVAGTSGPVEIDTGSSASLTLSRSQLASISERRSVEIRPFQGAMVRGVSGPIDGGALFRIPLTIGSLADIVVDGLAVPMERPTMNLGNGFLDDYRVTIDGPGRQLFLAPKDGDGDPAPVRPTPGFYFRRDGGRFVVKVVVDETPVARAGIEPGDRLLSIDGHGLDELDLEAECRLRERLGRHEVVSVTFEHGGESRTVSFQPSPLFGSSRPKPRLGAPTESVAEGP